MVLESAAVVTLRLSVTPDPHERLLGLLLDEAERTVSRHARERRERDKRRESRLRVAVTRRGTSESGTPGRSASGYVTRWSEGPPR